MTNARERLLELLDSYGPATGPGMSAARAMALVTGRQAPIDATDATCAAYMLVIAVRRPPAAHDVAGLLAAYDEAVALELDASQSVELAWESRDRALDQYVDDQCPIAAVDRAYRLICAFADHGHELKMFALAQLAHAAALVGLDGVELTVEGPCLI